MTRYQIGWSSMNRQNTTADECANYLRRNGARNVRLRYGYGWSNQPKTPTFTADSEREAQQIAAPFIPYDIATEHK